MKHIGILLLAVLLGMVFALVVFGAPAPFDNPHKKPEVVPGTYMMKFGDHTVPGECTLYPKGGYIHKYNSKQSYWEWCPGSNEGLEIFALHTEIILGEWKWDKATRVLTLRERLAGSALVDRVFKFQFKAQATETDAAPVDFNKIFLSMKRVK